MEPNPNDATKPRKVPRTVTGDFGSSTNPAKWSSYDEAWAAYQASLTTARPFNGLGFVFAAGGDYTGIDLDKCRDATTGALQPWAQRLVERFNSYTEISQSGTGVHVIVKATLPGPGKKKNRPDGVGAIEMYCTGRYFTWTGVPHAGAPATIEARQAEVADVYARLGAGEAAPAEHVSPSAASGPLTAEDEAIIAVIQASKDEPAWQRLFIAGETRPNRTGSENDSELASILCRHTDDDATVERIMRASPITRDKWDRKDYLARTIASARRRTGTGGGSAVLKEAPIIDFGALHDAPPPKTGWLVENIWPQGARGWIAGEAKIGKSWLALELAVAVASGLPFLDKYGVANKGRVWYLTEESTKRSIYNRVRMLLLAKNQSPDILRNQLGFVVRERVKLTDPRWRARLLTTLERERPVIVFIDPLRRYHDGDENDSTELQPVLDAAAELQEHGPAIVIIHHSRKTSEANADARAGQKLRGSSDLHAWGDAAMYCVGAGKNAFEVEVELKDEESPPNFVVGIEYGDPEEVDIGGERVEMKPARMHVRGEQNREQVAIREMADNALAFLRTQTKRLSVTAIKQNVSGKQANMKPALELLEEEKKADRIDGPHRSQLWAVVPAQASIPIANAASPDNPIEEDLPF